MSIQITRQVWKQTLPATEKLVLLCLADHADKDGRAWPSIRTIGGATGLKERAIQMALKSLAERGLIDRDERAGKGVIYNVHPRTKCAPVEALTPAANAPPHEIPGPPHEVRPTPALDAVTPAANAPKPTNRTINEPTNQPDALMRVCRAAGWHPPTNAKAEAARADLQSWIEAGYDVERHILPGITRAIAERPRDRTSSLRRFTTTIADEVRKTSHPMTNGSAPPPPPLAETDEPDQRIVMLRSDIRRQLGSATYDGWLAPGRTALAIDGSDLIVKARKGFNENWIRQHYGETIIAGAEALGLESARIVGI
ncbi:MAG: helix-turn-helix domain-containing protein [Sphingomicrobium sp.]